MDQDIMRHPCGAIDHAYYRRRADAARQAAIKAFFGACVAFVAKAWRRRLRGASSSMRKPLRA